MNIADITEKHNSHYRGLVQINKDIITELISYNFDLDKPEISEAIASRMWAFYETHDLLKNILGKSQKQAASDYFVESCLIFLKAYFEKIGFEVFSEKTIWSEGRRNIRPDVSIWKANNLIASIEMKVQLGRQRIGWQEELEKREIDIKSKTSCKYVATICFTEANWSGFTRDKNWETKYFSITNKDWKLNDCAFEKLIKRILYESQSS